MNQQHDRLGRRTLLTIGSFGYIASLGLWAWAFFTQHFAIVPACIFAFTRLRLPLLLWHDGASARLGENDGAGDKGVPLEEIQRKLGVEA